VPTSVDLFINGYRSGSTQLQPGPFTLTNLPYINGAGDAVLVTTDALGRQVSTTLPFYVTSDVLKQGLSDGAVTLGSLRRNYGIKSFDYGPAAGSGSYRYGLTDWLTLEGHAEGAQELALGGAGTVVKLGRFGVVNTSYTRSHIRGDDGGQINWGYQYSTSEFSLATQHSRRGRGYGNLALYDQPTVYDENNRPIASFSRNTDQYSLTFNLGQYGNIGAAWIGVESFDNQKTELLNLSWSRNLWGPAASIWRPAATNSGVTGPSRSRYRCRWVNVTAPRSPLKIRRIQAAPSALTTTTPCLPTVGLAGIWRGLISRRRITISRAHWAGAIIILNCRAAVTANRT
jgi:outer membrane usher protein